MEVAQTQRDAVAAPATKATDARLIGAELYLLPVATRMPLQFGSETLRAVTCARVRVTVAGRDGRTADGWGETPLNVEWAWPGASSHSTRRQAMIDFCGRLTAAFAQYDVWGHALEVGAQFQRDELPALIAQFNAGRASDEQLPLLAALVCCSPLDVALHDAYGRLLDAPIYETYDRRYLSRDLADLFQQNGSASYDFRGKYPDQFLAAQPPARLAAWHLVGGLDPLSADDLTGNEPDDGYPVLLGDWIDRDGLTCLKVKLMGVDAEWDFQRLVRVGRIGRDKGVRLFTADFNCSVRDPQYVNGVLDRLLEEDPELFAMLAYVEQPFPYDLERFAIDVHSVSQRKPLFMDESAHDWRFVEMGRTLGWTGVALKTCKTQTGALLSLCWAKAHDMQVMVQDLTNPMLAQIPHLLLAAYAETTMGVETNAMQFYPRASDAEAKVHPGLYLRRGGEVDLTTIRGPGFGYRADEITRDLPEPAVRLGQLDGAHVRIDPPAAEVRGGPLSF
jgi:L-alanine-DL-glutamate epimerase-like enolase superfamily enzyme